MAKDGKMDLPRVDGPKPGEQVFLKPGEAIVSGVPEVGLPYPTEGYVPRRVDVKMTRAQAIILQDKLRHLQDTGAKTADGRFVSNRTQAVQWLIENSLQIDR